MTFIFLFSSSFSCRKKAMTDWLTARRHATPNKPALYWAGEAFTFAELDAAASQWAGRLAGMGVKRGDVVAVLLNNCPGYIYLTFAVARLGAALLTLNTRLTAGEIQYQLREANAALVVGEAGLLEPLDLSLNCLTLVNAAKLLLADVPHQDYDPDARFCLMFTSGTTGQPKGVQLSLGNFYSSATASAFRLGVSPEDNWLCTLPLYHVGGLSIVLRSVLYGTALTLHKGFDVRAVAEALESGTVTLVSLVPTQLYRLLETDFKPHKNLRLILLGGAAVGEDLLQKAQVKGLPIATTYGLTEACSQVATALPETTFRKPGTVGKPLLFSELKLLDDDGKPVAANVVANVFVKGPNLMLGYLGKEPLDGWFNTGDLGYLDEEGDLFIVQRRRDLIVSGGENVYPAEVEKTLREHPALENVAVLGIDDAEWGQRVGAVLVLNEAANEAAVLEGLEQLCLTKLAPYKRPRLYKVVDALPLTASGKVKKHELVPLFASETS